MGFTRSPYGAGFSVNDASPRAYDAYRSDPRVDSGDVASSDHARHVTAAMQSATGLTNAALSGIANRRIADLNAPN